MNKEVKYLIDALSAKQKKQLKKDFENAPKMLVYINLLENNKTISTYKAINHIYELDIDDIDNTILTNRFYKLRQKLRIQLLEYSKNNATWIISEEQELIQLRFLVLQNKYTLALKRLQSLEKKCWEKNIFEILPEILSLILRCLHAFTHIDTKDYQLYLEKLELANKN